MASLFTFDSDQRVFSPWLTPTDSPKPSTPQPGQASGSDNNTSTSPSLLAEYGVSRLEAEPQEGPVEYKLHLLLRSRREYSSISTSIDHSAPKEKASDFRKDRLAIATKERTREKRQIRLQELSTQLLWRLQQSSPYHEFSTADLVLPRLPEANPSLTPPQPAKLLAGLEESRGALYEIGVSDDGTLVGLTKDEMDESLNNLRAMAASLGCTVKVIRMVVVGNCEWHEPLEPFDNPEHHTRLVQQNGADDIQGLRHHAELWVAEALISPDLSSRKAFVGHEATVINPKAGLSPKQVPELNDIPKTEIQNSTEQLRIALTGPTTSGKSTLLGTLSTSTLDNGRGKSRLSLLKHRHEIESGITSSITQELVGYKADQVVNYAYGNISSWTDIHFTAKNGRLVFVSDSAGHPRYRRTTVRGLIGWAPHWTLLCVAADDSDNAPSDLGGTASAQQILGTAGAGIDLAKAHLELCLKLDKPLAIVITKLDLASKTSLKQTLSKILTAVKAAGRTPCLLPPEHNKTILESKLGKIPLSDIDSVQKITNKLREVDGLTSIVPIILTSAAKGSGIRSLHSLLQNLPIPPVPTAHDFTGPALNPEQPACVFHIEDVFANQPVASESQGSGNVMAGHMRFGRLSIGDIVTSGPFPAESDDIDAPQETQEARSFPNSVGSTLFHHSATDLTRIASRNASASLAKGQWHNARIVSIRNLRLPVHTLEAGQVGTIGVVFDRSGDETRAPRMRKGMVIAIPSRHMIETGLQAATGFTACFEDSDINSVTQGSLVVVYIASVRATAKVLRLAPHAEFSDFLNATNDDDDVFGLDDSEDREEEQEPLIFGSDGITSVTFEFLTTREWIELGSQILVMPGGGVGLYSGSERGEKGVAGLEGFVGKVMEVVD